jgi:hypothetical protein
MLRISQQESYSSHTTTRVIASARLITVDNGFIALLPLLRIDRQKPQAFATPRLRLYLAKNCQQFLLMKTPMFFDNSDGHAA